MVWSGNSANRVPVAQEHLMIQGDTTSRHTTAEAALQELVQEIGAYLPTVTDLSEDVSATSWSTEGDTIHQLVDCIMLGPYAAADLQSTFELMNGFRLPVQQLSHIHI